MPTKLVIFYLDGVLINSLGLIHRAIFDLCFTHQSFTDKPVPKLVDFL